MNRLSRRIASLEAPRPALRRTLVYDWDRVPADLMERLAAAARGERELSDDEFSPCNNGGYDDDRCRDGVGGIAKA